MTTFALYARTSTDDLQDPADSLRWQTDTASRLVANDGEIAVIYHDIDSSRSLPWERRPQATRVLCDTRNPSRGWEALVIAEPHRAFSGAQFDSVVNVLHHFGVELWVPELGGRFDPENDGHWMMLANFGVLSRAERNRTRIRVRNAMRAHAQAGRWLGGRPPYGYRIADAGPHPNPSKAASGARLHRLEPDPDTAPTVGRIFQMYLAGSGFKAIATVLTNDRVPSPSAADPGRNTHRPGHAWAFTAVRAILENPRYLGRHVFGKQAKAEVLLDPDQPALGHVTRMRWQDRSEWLTATDATHERLVDETTWHRVQQLIAANGRPSNPSRSKGGASRRSAPSRYPLAGLIVCAHCGKKLQGSHTRGLAFYRCRIGSGYPVGPAGHPPTLAVREDRLLPHLDAWLAGLFAPGRVEDIAREVVQADALSHREDPAVTGARATLADCQRKLDRYLNALEAGMEPALVVARTAELQRERAAAEAVLANAPPPPSPLTMDEVVSTLSGLHGVPSLLAEVDPEDRAELYRALGVSLAYRRSEGIEEVKLQVNLGVDLERVGGGIWPSATRGAVFDLAA